MFVWQKIYTSWNINYFMICSIWAISMLILFWSSFNYYKIHPIRRLQGLRYRQGIVNCHSNSMHDRLPVKATKGKVWPKVQEQRNSNDFYIVRPRAFEFRVVAESCSLLEDALQRYLDIINNTILPHSRRRDHEFVKQGHQYMPWRENKHFAGYLGSLDVRLVNPCGDHELPTHTMNEKYILNINSTGTKNLLSATNIWGVLRGLETFSQLLFPTNVEALQINCTSIYDFPRFSHRGLLLDTSRHFIPVPNILKTLDAMAYNKLNVFHWHITDDQSFPYQSIKFPELSEKGAYLESQVYSQSDVKKIISYAGARGIRVIVEFDTPGHTRSWGEAIPVLLTPCYKNASCSGKYGPMDPTKKFLFDFLREFFGEIIQVFPEQYLHLGGDEVEFECWESNPDINDFMKQNNIITYSQLEGYYIQKLLDIVHNMKAKTIVWEDVFTNGIKIPNTTLVHVWKLEEWETTMQTVTGAGYPALLSACWYLSHLSAGGDWDKFYNCEPYNFAGTPEQKKLVVGGEACMWAEAVNEYNVESRIWPRASAVAEKLWSAYHADVENAQERLEEHTCRMNKRDIGAQPPNYAGFCEL